jgi:putative NIF3 family GTP cyclohydrolase 1 type 2
MGECQPLEFGAFLKHVKTSLDCGGLRYAGNGTVKTVAVGGGTCGEYWKSVLKAGCDTFVTSDVKYHDFLDIAEAGLNVIDAGHFPTENTVVPTLANTIHDAFPQLILLVSERHCDKVNFYR